MKEKAKRANEIIHDYRDKYDKDEDSQTVLVDLLADLMHWAEAVGVDFDGALEWAAQHFTWEKEEEDA